MAWHGQGHFDASCGMQDQELRDWLFHQNTKRYFTMGPVGHSLAGIPPAASWLKYSTLFANLLRAICDQTEVLPTGMFSWPFLCESFRGRAFSPSRAAATTSITSHVVDPFSSTASHLHSLPRLEVGIAWLRATPKPSWQRREACSTEVSAYFHTRAVSFCFGLTTLAYLVFFIHSQASHAGSTME